MSAVVSVLVWLIIVCIVIGLIGGREEKKDKPTEWEKDEAWRRSARTHGSTTKRSSPGG